MPIGARECNLKIQHNSVPLRLEVLDVSNFAVHHTNTVNCMCLWLLPITFEVSWYWCDLSIFLNSWPVIIYSFAKCSCLEPAGNRLTTGSNQGFRPQPQKVEPAGNQLTTGSNQGFPHNPKKYFRDHGVWYLTASDGTGQNVHSSRNIIHTVWIIWGK